MSDLISRQAALAYPLSWDHYDKEHGNRHFISGVESYREYIESLPSTDRKGDWIPVKWHEIKDAEREEEGYPKEWAAILDCEMPLDEQEILVTTQWGTVSLDVCYEDGGFGLESGWDWMEDIIAWMPLPEPYRKEKDQ